MFVIAHVNKFSVAFAHTMYLQYLICIIQVSLENRIFIYIYTDEKHYVLETKYIYQ